MFWIAEAMTRWLAPILSFTAEELWGFMPGKRDESVFFGAWAQLPQGASARPNLDWDAIFAVRGALTRELEKIRNAGAIGGPLDAEIDIYTSGALLETLQQFGEELRFVFITSGAQVHPADARTAEAVAVQEGDGNTVWIAARPTPAQKCVRCWHKRPDIGANPKHPELCGRCATNIEGPGETRRFI
jgi:isoleucyl-tRNA synthetase